MTKFTREYYTISKAEELLGYEPDYLLHNGAMGHLPIFVMAKHWGGTIYDLTNVNGFFYATPREWVRLPGFAWLFPKTLQCFEEGVEEVTVAHTWHPPNPETGQERHIELDDPVVIKKTQLFVLTKDIQNLAFEAPSHKEGVANKKTPRPKTSSESELIPPDLAKENLKITKPIEPVETMAKEGNTVHRLLRIEEVMELTGLGRQTIYDAIKAGRFPKQVYPTGKRAARWDNFDILALMKSGVTNSLDTEKSSIASKRGKKDKSSEGKT